MSRVTELLAEAFFELRFWLRQILCRHLEPREAHNAPGGINWTCPRCGKITERERWV